MQFIITQQSSLRSKSQRISGHGDLTQAVWSFLCFPSWSLQGGRWMWKRDQHSRFFFFWVLLETPTFLIEYVFPQICFWRCFSLQGDCFQIVLGYNSQHMSRLSKINSNLKSHKGISDELNVYPYPSADDDHLLLLARSLVLRLFVWPFRPYIWYFESVHGCWNTYLIFWALSSHFVIKIREVAIYFGLRPSPHWFGIHVLSPPWATTYLVDQN